MGLSRLRDRLFGHWRGSEPHPAPLVFLTPAMAVRPSILGHRPDDAYRCASGFFGVGLIDRAGALGGGFPVAITDPIPETSDSIENIATLCDRRGAALVAEASERNMPLRLLWSGGIDSTVAAVSVLKALDGEIERLEICHTRASIREYRRFHKLLKKLGIPRRRLKRIGDALTPDALIVTGEHGDQIFGSMLAGDLPERDMHRPWSAVVPDMLRTKLDDAQADLVLAALEHQTRSCPIPVGSAFEALWWWNFSMKWSTVAYRLTVALPDAQRNAVDPLLRHFFRTEPFQRWSLANPDKRIRERWDSYKWPLKDYIFDFTEDRRYRDRKTKERSLRGLLPAAQRALAIDSDGARHSQALDRSLRGRNRAEWVLTIEE